jgi:hypothetical protein
MSAVANEQPNEKSLVDALPGDGNLLLLGVLS